MIVLEVIIRQSQSKIIFLKSNLEKCSFLSLNWSKSIKIVEK